MRKLKKIDVNFISLVDKGANRKKLIFKSIPEISQSLTKTLPIRKIDDEQRMVFCIVYSPDEIDTQGDFASAEVIKEAAYNFMRCARTNNVDKQHDFIPDEGFVAESWIVKENDSVFQEEPEGSWAVGIKVENDETWQLIKNGVITGISLAGLAVTEEGEKQNESQSEKESLINNLQNCSSLNDLQNWFIKKTEDETIASIEKEKSIEEKISSCDAKISRLEIDRGDLQLRLDRLENSTLGSRQIKKDSESFHDKIKIWT